MKTKAWFALLGFALFVLPVRAQKTIEKPLYLQDAVEIDVLPQTKNKYDRFKQQLLGHFSNHRYLEETANKEEKKQEIIAIPLFKDRPNEHWVYREFFSSVLPESPISQRIENYIRVGRDTIRVELYFLKEPQKYVNEWRKAKPFEGLTKEALVRDSGCDQYILVPEESEAVFRGISPEEVSCALQSPSGSARYLQLWFDVSDEGYLSFLRLYDIDKKMLRQSPPEGTRFYRLDYRQESYQPHETEKNKKRS